MAWLVATGPKSATRNPERPILLACGAVGLLFAMLAVLERVGVDRNVLGALAVALPLVAAVLLALMGRTIERLPFVVDGARGGTLAGGLALGAEWMGVWLVPAVVLAPAVASAPVLGAALGIALAAILAHGPLRRMGALSLPTFLAWRTGNRLGGLSAVPATLVAVGGLLVFQTALLHALLVPFVGAASGTLLAVLVTLAALVCLVGGQRSLTLVNAFLAFFLTLAMVVPAVAALAGIDGLTAALPLDRAFAAALPVGNGGLFDALATLAALALAALALPSFGMRLAAVRRGGLAQATAWTLLTGYVTMAAAVLAFAHAALAPGLSVGVHGEASILSVLPALGWLGAAWAGLAMSLFTLAAILARDLRVSRISRERAPRPWMDATGLVVMRLVFIAAAMALWLVDPAPLVNIATAKAALSATLVAAGGCLAPALLAGTLWRHVTVPGLAVGQIAGAAVAILLWGVLDALPLALLTAAATTAALVPVSLVTPRRYRPRPSLVLQVRDP